MSNRSGGYVRHVDLFTGIGGFALAVEEVWEDGEHVLFCEIEEFCQEWLGFRWPGVPIVEDVHDIEQLMSVAHASSERGRTGEEQDMQQEQPEQPASRRADAGGCNLVAPGKGSEEHGQPMADTEIGAGGDQREDDRSGSGEVDAPADACRPAYGSGRSDDGSDEPVDDTVPGRHIAENEAVRTGRDGIVNPDGTPRIDILTAGVPCQPASHAGKRAGTADPRWCWPQTLTVVERLRPRWCVFENPPGILTLGKPDGIAEVDDEGVPLEEQVPAENSEKFSDAIGHVFEDLERLGYDFPRDRSGNIVIPAVPAAGVGAPHRRMRCWIVAYDGRACTPRFGEDSWEAEAEQGGVRDGSASCRGDVGNAAGLGLPQRTDDGGVPGHTECREQGQDDDLAGSDVADTEGLRGGEAPDGEGQAASGDGSPGEDVVDSEGEQSPCQQRAGHQEDGAERQAGANGEQGEPGGGCGMPRGSSQDVADLSGEGLEGTAGRELQRQCRGLTASYENPWADGVLQRGADGSVRLINPAIRLLADGVPNRVSQLRALGNSIVPQVAREILAAIREADEGRR